MPKITPNDNDAYLKSVHDAQCAWYTRQVEARLAPIETSLKDIFSSEKLAEYAKVCVSFCECVWRDQCMGDEERQELTLWAIKKMHSLLQRAPEIISWRGKF